MRFLCAFLLLNMLGGCVGITKKVDKQDRSVKTNVVMPAADQPVKAIAVIVHGLNFNPVHMDDWTRLFVHHGIGAIRLVLPGHGGSPNAMKDISATLWRNEIDEAMINAQMLANTHKVPLVFVGYSLGGLVGLDWLARRPEGSVLFNKMILLAPAIATPWFSFVAEKLVMHLDGNLMIPTPNRRMFRADKYGSSIHAYRALFDLKSTIEAAAYRNANIETLLFVDRFDELTPYAEVKKTIEHFRLSQWRLELINNRYAHLNHGFRHLIATVASVGQKRWEDMSQRVLRHIGVVP